ncbi:MAG: TonB-dependent receptor [Dysgonamonadaceae bacterium]|nr:TonB-dependent receptor [Dysgonamonadaceae bacterium]
MKTVLFLLMAFLLCSMNGYAQESAVSGVVSDVKGEFLPGVSVRVKGTNTGIVTDADGKYSLNVEGNAVLVFSYVGMKSIEENVNNRRTINVTLSEDTELLDEVVVVGYGTQKRVTMTGAVSQVSSKDLLKAPMQNVSSLLTGKASGLTSIQRSGNPGDDGTTLLVRGLNTFGNSSPMLIVDGVSRPINYVNPNDIESISVLKDASAAIYGMQGGGGVILITTKSGGEGPAKISYDGSYTMTQNTAMPEFLNAVDYMYWNNKAYEMDGLTPPWTADIQNRVLSNDPNSIWGETNWLDKIFKTGQTWHHNISASGGTERTKYYASLGIMDQDGTMHNTGYTRYNMRANLDIQVAKNLRFMANVSGLRSDRYQPGSDIVNQGEFNPVRQAISTIPIIKSEYEGLPVAWNGSSYYVNGYAALTESGFKRQNRWVFDSNYKLEYDFSGLTNALKGLKMSVFGAYNYSNTTDQNYDRYYELYYVNRNFDEGITGASGYTPGGGFAKSASWGDTWMLRPQIEYSRDFGKHSVNALLLYEAQKNYSNTMTGVKRGFYSDDPIDLSLGTTFTETPVSGSYSYTGQASYVGRFNYAYDSKYLFEATFRRDGSYIFPADNRWGFFPSVSLGWVASQEEFFANALSVVDYFKIRASYGESGINDVDPFQHQSTYAVANNSYVLGGKPLAQFYSSNPYIYHNLTWSTIHNYNIGIDADLWNRLLGIELDVFYQLTTGILERQSGNYPPSLASYFPAFQNSGEVDNKGFEITLKHDNRINSDWSYGLKGSFSYARNRVLKRAVTDNYPNYRAQLGAPMGARYGLQALGFFQTQEEIDAYPAAPSGMIRLGDLKYKDVNGDGLISSQYDYIKTGYGGVPEINFSMDMNVSFKNFYASMLWQGVSHTDYELSGVYNTGVTSSTNFTASFAEQGNSPYYRIEGAWTPENALTAKYPRLSTVSNGNNAWQSTWWVVNGEYLRLKNATIGYTVPDKVLAKTPFSRINIYLAGTNLLTFSHFKYVDPEAPSVSNGYYPQQMTFSAGVNVTF